MAAEGDHLGRGEGQDRSRRRRGRPGHLRATGPLSTGDDARRRLDDLRDGAHPEVVLAFFDTLPAAVPAELAGRWRGSGLPTGSPLDGLLESYGWYGKEFLDAETVHPLLFRDRTGRPRPLDPALLPVRLLRDRPGLAHLRLARMAFGVVRPVLWTDEPKARLRTVEHRGVPTAVMVYDALPIIDVFRRVDDDTLLGLMDLRGLPRPFFFLLERDDPGPRRAGPWST